MIMHSIFQIPTIDQLLRVTPSTVIDMKYFILFLLIYLWLDFTNLNILFYFLHFFGMIAVVVVTLSNIDEGSECVVRMDICVVYVFRMTCAHAHVLYRIFSLFHHIVVCVFFYFFFHFIQFNHFDLMQRHTRERDRKMFVYLKTAYCSFRFPFFFAYVYILVQMRLYLYSKMYICQR